jgi:hypothetical protein
MLDKQEIDRLADLYRRLKPERLAALDEDRHMLSGEQATALDRIISEPALCVSVARSISDLDRKKQKRFRFNVCLYGLLCLALTIFSLYRGR